MSPSRLNQTETNLNNHQVADAVGRDTENSERFLAEARLPPKIVPPIAPVWTGFSRIAGNINQRLGTLAY